MTDWNTWRSHIDAIITNAGQWVGLADENAHPLMDAPPVVSMSAPEQLLAPSSLQLMVNARGRHAPVHLLVDELIANDLGVLDEEGRLVPSNGPTRMIIVQRAGQHARRGFLISHAIATGGAHAPATVEIHGVDLLDMLAWWPCPSAPRTWAADPGLTEWQRDAAMEWSTPRRIAAVEMADVADGYTVHGPAELILATLIQDSLDAVNTVCGWMADPHMVVDMTPSGRPSPEVTIRVDDASIYDTIAEPASLAGIDISVNLWWPGDDPVTVRTPTGLTLRTWDRPIAVVHLDPIGDAEHDPPAAS